MSNSNQLHLTEEHTRVYHQIVSLQLSWNCNAACRQCMVSGQEKRSRVMTLAEAKRIIDQLQFMPLTHFLGFTGGEVFLHYKLLLDIGKYVKEKYGYGFGIATNGYWAESMAKAEEMLRPLVDVGLKEVMVSLDDFHLEFVDAKCIENCVAASLAHGLHVTVQSIKTRTGHDVSYFQKHLSIPAPPAVAWISTPCHPAGRAVKSVPEDEFVRDWSNKPGHCTALHVWNIDPFGWVTPCCGTAMSRRLKVGNAFKEDLSSIVNRTNIDPLINTIAAWGGPYLIIKLLEKNGDYRYSDRKFASHCHACDTVLRDPRALKVCDRELPEHWLEALSSRLAAENLWHRLFVFKDENANWLPAGWVDTQDRAAEEIGNT